jgi:hypothetical protein
MDSLIRKVIGALTIAALLSTTVFAIGCSGGDEGSERAIQWGVDRTVGSKSVRLAAPVEYCSAEPPRLERPIIEYSGDRVYIELRRTPEELEEGQNGCLLSLLVLYETITFKRDLDELVLLDASTDPPEQRWPRRR